MPVALDPRRQGQLGLEGGDGVAGLILLPEADDGVDHQQDEDDAEIGPVPHRRPTRSTATSIIQGIGPQKYDRNLSSGLAFFFGQLVVAMLCPPPLDFVRAQPFWGRFCLRTQTCRRQPRPIGFPSRRRCFRGRGIHCGRFLMSCQDGRFGSLGPAEECGRSSRWLGERQVETYQVQSHLPRRGCIEYNPFGVNELQVFPLLVGFHLPLALL